MEPHFLREQPASLYRYWGHCIAQRLLWVCLALTVAPASSKGNASDWRYLQNGPESAADERYAYHRKVLQAALEVTRNDFGGYTMGSAPFMTESRQIVEMQRADGLINTLVLDPTLEMMRDLIPVRVPIDKGLLGYRVFLIRGEDQERFSAVRTLDDLRKFSMGQGSDWSDVAIYRAADFKVVTGVSYDGLFNMLMVKRFDAFGRGATEVLGEWSARRKELPAMAVEKDLLLYYPMPTYFWFQKTMQGQQMALRVDQGMRKLVANGALDKMFKAEFGALIERLQLKRRRIFHIPNPNLPPDEPFEDKRLWFDPLK
jgi:ABC-type amino acid transport substrate-binding protein